MPPQNFSSEYKYGFVTPVESETFAAGLNEEVIKTLSQKKNEPPFVLKFRLKAYEIWKKLENPLWGNFSQTPLDFQKISYFSEPKSKPKLSHLDEVDPEILNTLKRLGIPLDEQKKLMNVAVDVVFDSVSLGTTFQKKLEEHGVILCSLSKAFHTHGELLEKFLGTIVPPEDNFYAALNSAVFSDGSFVYVPKGVKCPVELSTYFRINEKKIGQFERTFIFAEEDSSVSYLEGCTAPSYDINQLHAAVVELIAHKNASIKYSTVQNWYAGDPQTGLGGIYNFVTKRGLCLGDFSKISWTQVEVGAAITWKYPSCILQGDFSSGEFFSIACTNGQMQADTGTKMIHLGKNTRSMILSKGISADQSSNTYRGKVFVDTKAKNARNYSQCDSLLIGNLCSAHTYPSIEARNASSQIEHEASTSQISEDQIFYLQSRGLSKEEALSLILNGFYREVIQELPLEFAIEAKKIISMKLEHSIG